MALVATEHWALGFVFADAANAGLAHTAVLTGATPQNGLLRDPDGRLITSAGPGAYDRGFIRDSNGALVVAAGESTPPLYSFGPRVEPVNTVAPAVTGTATVGSTLTSTTGTWTGSPTPTFTYQWRRNGVAIGGATASTYLIDALDVGTSVTCQVTATNARGSAAAVSNAVVPA